MSRFLRSAVATTAAGLALAAGGAVAAGAATADSEFPTAGDRVQYTFYSDVKVNESVHWLDANNDSQSLTPASLPSLSKDRKLRSGTISFTSRSTYQLAGASIQTSGYYAACQVRVNGVVVSKDSATGRYAVAVC
ncbi:hypothetical protein [Gordonia hydrophobica]|uniref:Uncharacterized protein n=1 Tax=Gordonia hydrophobica TaxID=40516 RepID=A0ABZ2U110_9ACTN|nr:hypothetical protein [Gordonia hydrophobica]MBM7366525.1 hypothetical protein [Gordonia hydrophobica]